MFFDQDSPQIETATTLPVDWMKNYGEEIKICVIGAGVVGLSTALKVLETFPNVKLHVVADEFLEDTLSYGAGGFFRPELNIGPNQERILKWAKDSYKHFSRLAIENPDKSGNSFVSGYQITADSLQAVRNPLVEEIVPPIRILSHKEIQMFGDKFANGIFWTSIITDPRYYLPYLQEKITELGGVIEKMHVNSFAELLYWKEFDVIINCTGMGSAKLTEDIRLTPVRGQTIKVKAPWIRHFYFGDGAYILPGRDYVTLGGIKDYGNSSKRISELDRKSIWTRCTEMVPSLKNAEVISEWVGLRPQRQPVRVEFDRKILMDNNCKCLLAHNYGHGGHGVTLSWGTATDIVDMIRVAFIKK